MTARHDGPLLERDDELDALDGLLSEAGAGGSRVVVVEARRASARAA